MKQLYFQLFLVVIMSTSALPPFVLSASQPEGKTDFRLTSRSERLEEVAALPVTDEALQRMYLVRHGESTANVYFEIDGKRVRYVSGQSPNIPLTETGREQILALAKKLAERFPKEARLMITSSTALRTRQTAQILFQELSKIHPNVVFCEEVYSGLNERHLGDWEGRLKDESYIKAESPWKALPAAEKFFTPEVEEGECYSQVAERALSALGEIYGRYYGATVIAVTSFNTINAVAIKMNDLVDSLPTDPASNLPRLDLGNGDLVLLETGRNLTFEETRVISHIKN